MKRVRRRLIGLLSAGMPAAMALCASLRLPVALIAVSLVTASALAPGAASAQILNSERIEQAFGSYGIDVLSSDAGVRVSNLYSRHEGRKITRSLAIVGYPERLDPAFAEEHARILAGGSIGAIFADSGWEVVKTRHQYFEARAGIGLARAMQIAEGTSLAAHAYRLSIVRSQARFDYALIIEIHHPAYLDRAMLESIYGEAETDGLREETRRLLEAGLDRLGREGSALGQ